MTILNSMKYSRQEILSKKTVAVVGVGTIGTVTSALVNKLGVNLILIDRDVVEIHNLENQILYAKEDVDKPKAIVAAEKLRDVNPRIKIESFCEDLTFENIDLLDKADIVLDCTDNLETRFLINDYCLSKNKPWIYAAGIKTKCTLMNFTGKGVCFRCIFKETTGLGTCETEGIANQTAIAVGSLQVKNALQILVGETVDEEMLRLDIMTSKMEKIKVQKRKDCKACAGEYEFLEGRKGTKAIKLCGKEIYQIKETVDFNKFKKDNSYFVTIKNITLFKDGRALVKAKNEKEARSAYSKLIGN